MRWHAWYTWLVSSLSKSADIAMNFMVFKNWCEGENVVCFKYGLFSLVLRLGYLHIPWMVSLLPVSLVYCTFWMCMVVIVLCWTIHLYEILFKWWRILSFNCHTASTEAHLSNNFFFSMFGFLGLLTYKLSTIFHYTTKFFKISGFLIYLKCNISGFTHHYWGSSSCCWDKENYNSR